MTVRRDGKRWKQVYSRGVPQEELQYIGESDSHGTTVRFKPDETIFETTEFSYDTLKKRFEELARASRSSAATSVPAKSICSMPRAASTSS